MTGELGFGLMQDGGQYGGPVSLARSRDPRFAYAQALANSALNSETPIYHRAAGIGQLAKAAVSGIMMNKLQNEYQNRDADYARSIANALQAGQGQPAETKVYSTPDDNGEPTRINWNAVAPDPQKQISILAQNRDTAPMAMSIAQNEQNFARQRAATKEDQTNSQGFTREMAGVQHNYNVASMELQQAFAASQQDKSIAAQERLQKAQQGFTAAQQAASQAFQLNSAGPIAEAGATGTLKAQNAPVQITLPGSTSPVTVPAGAAIPLVKDAVAGQPTADQAKSGGYADRMMAANGLIDKFGSAGTDWVQTGRGAIPVVGNAVSSPEYQQLVQAKRDFVNAKLRQESGAAISQSEFDNADKQYFPQPGDKPETLKNKAELRSRVIYGMQQEAGNKYKPMGAAPATSAAPAGIIRYDAEGNRVP